MLDRIVNLELLSNPLNWVIVVLMVLLGSMMMNFLFASIETQGN